MRISKVTFVVAVAALLAGTSSAQQTVTFPSGDGVTITASLYVVDINKPYILLLHQAGYSRGEYNEIAPKLTKLGYNCLAADLRSGNEVNFTKNVTAAQASQKGLPTQYIDALPDIQAAIDYIKEHSNLPIIIWGSSYSASLAMVAASNNLRIGAVVAFSPGEYFADKSYVRSNTHRISVPVFATSAKTECEQTKLACSSVKPDLLTIFCPVQSGKHGSSALWESNTSNSEYWLALSVFFSKLENLK